MTIASFNCSADVVLRFGFPTFNYGQDTYLIDTPTPRALLKFDLSSIPAGSVCNSATLYLYKVLQGAALAFTLTVYSVSIDNNGWIEGTGNGALALNGEPCWNAREADGAGGVKTAWHGSAGASTADEDYETPSIGSFNGNRSDAVGTQYTASLTASRIQGWFGAVNTNYGLLCSLNNECGAIGSRQHATAGYRPRLDVDYCVVNTITTTTVVVDNC